MIKQDTISVIVPVYKVENYLNRCVSSIVNQTYQNLEIILVDDGSPDRCGEMCDEWAKRDERILVIHKPNGGLSDARNAGIDAAHGEYIAFVDSDDFIAPDMIDLLYSTLVEHHAEISLCNFLYVDEDGNELAEKNQDLPIQNELLDGLEGIKRLFESKGWYYVTAWNKLYSADLFSNLRFPKGKIHEDEFLAHRVFGLCERIVCIQEAKYFYVQRPGSIMQTRGEKSLLHAAEAFLDRAEFTFARGMVDCARKAYCKSGLFFSQLLSTPISDPNVKEEARKFYRQFRRNAHLRNGCSIKERIKIDLLLLDPRLYNLIQTIYHKVLFKNR